MITKVITDRLYLRYVSDREGLPKYTGARRLGTAVSLVCLGGAVALSAGTTQAPGAKLTPTVADFNVVWGTKTIWGSTTNASAESLSNSDPGEN